MTPRKLAAAASLLTMSVSVPAMAYERGASKVEVAREVFVELMEAPDRGVPEELAAQARCVAIIPSVIKGAFVWGGRRGRGVMSCRTDAGWSPVTFVKLSGGSVGFQAGGEASDLVLFFLTERGAKSLLTSKFILGGDVGVAAGPVGRSAEANTDLRLKAEVIAYARSRGFFAGVAIQGARLAPDRKWTLRYYGEPVSAERILFAGDVPHVPAETQRLIDTLP